MNKEFETKFKEWLKTQPPYEGSGMYGHWAWRIRKEKEFRAISGLQPIVRRCGTCKYFLPGIRNFCNWQLPDGVVISAAYHKNSMGSKDGENCPTWEKE